jgi:histone H1/5
VLCYSFSTLHFYTRRSQISKMSAVAAASPAKKAARKSTTTTVKKVASHPTYAAMVKTAVKTLNDRTGSSKAAILKYIVFNFKIGPNINPVNAHVRMALKAGVKDGSLKQVKGTGASGSFKLGDKALKAPKKKVVKKPKADKKPKATVAKKSPKKKASPKKVKAVATVAKKSPKKPKSPKKVKVAAKKSPVKKTTKKSPKKTTKKATKA